jgi:hypothetical protein
MSIHLKTRLVVLALWLFGGAIFALAADGPPPPTPTPAPAEHRDHDTAMEAPAEPRNLFSSDMTAMLGMRPQDPMGGMVMPGWHLMDMGVVHLTYNRQGGKSGSEAFESTNWNMVHAQHDLWGGRFSLMLMNSLEPETMKRRGSPELFQEGETLDKQPLVDVQHPHDFFMNLSATYRHPLGEEGGFWVQYAPVGEPALGPTAFMHRASSGDNPAAPLGHHGQDSTHITFGVVTAGVGWRFFAVEGSAFRGAEPDENRWNFEHGKLDSASGRVKFFLPGSWSAQASYGSIRNPELLFPGVMHRLTASLHYGADGDQPVAVSLIWGRDRDSGRGAPSIAIGFFATPLAVRHPNAPRGYTDYFLLEGAWQFAARDQVYGRGEYLDRNFQLLFTKQNALPGQPVGVNIVRVKAITLGYVRDFQLVEDVKTGAGGDVTAYRFPQFLNGVYGGSPLSTHFFFRIRWGKPHGMDHMM